MLKNKKIGLALGSGAAKGWAHLGVLQALEEIGLKADFIAGTSMGSVVGAVHASGRTADIRRVALDMDWRGVMSHLDVVFPRSGLIDGRKVARLIRRHLAAEKIEDFPTPFCAVATDLAAGQPVVLDSGDAIEAIRASISIPGIFTPVSHNGMVLVDGGVVDPVPVGVARRMGADYVIAVDVGGDLPDQRLPGQSRPGPVQAGDPEEDNQADDSLRGMLDRALTALKLPTSANLKWPLEREDLPTIFDVILGAVNIMQARITEARLAVDPPDLLIRPRLGHIRLIEFHRAQEAMAEGYVAAVRALAKVDLSG